jgi:hypothetical protein
MAGSATHSQCATNLTAVGYDQDRSFMLVEVCGGELTFQTVSRSGKTVDSGVIRY